MNVLIADDDPFMIRLLSSGLRRNGFETYLAYDVLQATQMIQRHQIDAVVLDISMPGGSGAEVIRRLRMFKQTVNIPIVVVSGTVGDDARKKLLDMGADDFFPKPADIEQLAASVRRLIRLRADAVEAETREL